MQALTFLTPGTKIYLQFHKLSLPVQIGVEQRLLQVDLKKIPLSTFAATTRYFWSYNPHQPHSLLLLGKE